MSISQITNINTITAINDNLPIAFSSTNSAQPYFKFIFDLYVNGSFVARFKKVDGSFCPSDILLSYIDYDYIDSINPSSDYQLIGDLTMAYWNVEVGEEYDNGSGVTEFPAIVTSSTYFGYYGKSDLVSNYYTNDLNSKWISCVNEINLNYTDSHFIYIAVSLSNLPTHIDYSVNGGFPSSIVVSFGGSPAPSTLKSSMIAVNIGNKYDGAIPTNYIDIWLRKGSTQITEKYRVNFIACQYDNYTFLSPFGNYELQKFKTNNKVPSIDTTRLSFQNNDTQNDFHTKTNQNNQKFTTWLTENENTIFKNFFQSFNIRQQTIVDDGSYVYVPNNIVDGTLIEKTNYNDGLYSYAINLKEAKQLINK